MTISKQKPEPDWVSLLSKILANTPRLEGAACVGRPELFEPQGEREPIAVARRRHAVAAGICTACPVLSQCGQWAQTERRLMAGVIAGRTPAAPKRRGRPTIQSRDREVVK